MKTIRISSEKAVELIKEGLPDGGADFEITNNKTDINISWIDGPCAESLKRLIGKHYGEELVENKRISRIVGNSCEEPIEDYLIVYENDSISLKRGFSKESVELASVKVAQKYEVDYKPCIHENGDGTACVQDEGPIVVRHGRQTFKMLVSFELRGLNF